LTGTRYRPIWAVASASSKNGRVAHDGRDRALPAGRPSSRSACEIRLARAASSP